jgi:hypothetical protein
MVAPQEYVSAACNLWDLFAVTTLTSQQLAFLGLRSCPSRITGIICNWSRKVCVAVFIQ